jgi:hypothetical protein
MKAYPSQQFPLNKAAASPDTVITISKGIMHVLRALPKQWVDILAKSTFDDDTGRDLAVQLLRQPPYARNFFELGTEEIRDVPETVDVRIVHFFQRLSNLKRFKLTYETPCLQTSSLRIIGKHCPIAMLYCGNDQWGPDFHQVDIKELQLKNVLPKNIAITYMPELRHDYVSYDHMVPKAVDWCFESIQAALESLKPRSRL